LLQEDLVTGGYPEEVLSPNPAYLPNLMEDILARSLMRLFPVKKPAALKECWFAGFQVDNETHTDISF